MIENDTSVGENNMIGKVNEVTTSAHPQKGKSSSILIYILVPVLLLIVACVAYYFLIYAKSGVTTLKQTINKSYGYVDKAFDYLEKNDNTNIGISGNIALETDVEELKQFNGYKLDYNYIINSTDKKLSLDAALKDSDKEILNAVANVVDNKIYVSLKDIYADIIEYDALDTDINTIFEGVNVDNVKEYHQIIESLKNYAIESFEEDMFVKKYEKTDIGGKNKVALKLTLEMNYDNSKKYINNFLDKIGTNNELLNKIVKVVNDLELGQEMTVKDITDFLNNIKTSINEVKAEDFGTGPTIIIYKNFLGTKIVKLIVTAEEKTYNYDENVYSENSFTTEIKELVKYENYDNKMKLVLGQTVVIESKVINKQQNIIITMDGTEYAKIVFKENNKAKKDCTFEVIIPAFGEEPQKITGSFVYEKKTDITNIKLDAKYNEDTISIITKTENKKDIITNTSEIKAVYNGKNIKINSNETIDKNAKVRLLDVTNAKKYSSLTNQDVSSIADKFQEKIASGFSTMFGGSNKAAVLVEAQSLSDAAQIAYQQLLLQNDIKDTESACFDLSFLVDNEYYESDDLNVSGSVYISSNASIVKVWYKDSKYIIGGVIDPAESDVLSLEDSSLTIASNCPRTVASKKCTGLICS